MLYIFTESHSEAKGFIEYYHLKKNMSEPHFEIFRNEDCSVMLTVTGKGAVRGAMAVGYVMAGRQTNGRPIDVGQIEGRQMDVRQTGENDIFLCVEHSDINSDIKESALVYEIHNEAEDRYFYPDMCPDNPFCEISSDSLYMSALYEALECFVMQHQLVFARTGEDEKEWIPRLCRFLGDFWKNYEGRHPFHHVYIERKIEADGYVRGITDRLGRGHTGKISENLHGSWVLPINHYKDIFNRKNQSLDVQKASPALVLAKKEGKLIYEGSGECQNFGNRYFYYTSCMMNCLFDCEYCYLQGMYPSADVVLFTNIDDIFRDTDELLREHDVYLCVSYDTDIIALENLTGYCRRWIDYAVERDEKSAKQNGFKGALTIEIRTKAAIPERLMEYAAVMTEKKLCENIIFAFTLTPKMIKLSYERGTSSVNERLNSIKEAAQKGLKVRVCFDPLIITENYRQDYRELAEELFSAVEPERIYDVSLGEFRVPCDYFKRMKKRRKRSRLLTESSFVSDKESVSYGEKGAEAADFLEGELLRYIEKEKIYRWR